MTLRFCWCDETPPPPAVLGGPILFCEGQPLRTASKDHHPPTANRHQPPTAANRQPSFNSAVMVLCRAHVLTMKQRASPCTFVSVGVANPFFPPQARPWPSPSHRRVTLQALVQDPLSPAILNRYAQILDHLGDAPSAELMYRYVRGRARGWRRVRTRRRPSGAVGALRDGARPRQRTSEGGRRGVPSTMCPRQSLAFEWGPTWTRVGANAGSAYLGRGDVGRG